MILHDDSMYNNIIIYNTFIRGLELSPHDLTKLIVAVVLLCSLFIPSPFFLFTGKAVVMVVRYRIYTTTTSSTTMPGLSTNGYRSGDETDCRIPRCEYNIYSATIQ